jgi:hypothetical protein
MVDCEAVCNIRVCWCVLKFVPKVGKSASKGPKCIQHAADKHVLLRAKER